MLDNVQEYKYDAFISYCHLPLDGAVAKKLEELLENFRSPKITKKITVFRDKDELKASSDLQSDIRDALLHSRYLIVVCSEKTKGSLWCMEEIRLFKEAHANSTKNILILLASGEPEEVFPESLCWTMDPAADPAEGQSVSYKKIVPLSADVRGKTRRQSLRSLKVEFLRIAAVILECEFDELYQRQQRRKRRRAAVISAGTSAVLFAVLVVVSIFAYRTWVSENNYRDMLAQDYAQKGSAYADSGSAQEALLYYTKALSLEPGIPAAAAGASLLLQEYGWPVQKEELPGCLEHKEFLPVPLAQAGDAGKGYYLTPSSDGKIVDETGSQIAVLGEGYSDFQGASAGWWIFQDKDEMRFYDPQTEQRRSIPWPKEASAGCTADLSLDTGPSAFVLTDDRVIVSYQGILHLYSFDAQGKAVEEKQADLGDAFTEDAEDQTLVRSSEIYLSDDSSLALVRNRSQVALYQTDDLTLKTTVVQYGDFLTGMDISPENNYFVLTYGSEYLTTHMNPGGHFEVYSIQGELLFESPADSQEAVLGAAFYPEDPDHLAVWGNDRAYVWNWSEGKKIAAPVETDGLRSACFGKDGSLLVDNDGRTVSVYTVAKMDAVSAGSEGEEGKLPVTVNTYGPDAEGPDGMRLSVSVSDLTLIDAQGNELDTVSLPAMGQCVALSLDRKWAYLYNTNYPALMRVPVDLDTGKLGNVQMLDTGSEAVLAIWFGDGWLAAETKSRDLLLFDEKGQQIGRIAPKQVGNVTYVLVDPRQQYMVLVMEADAYTKAGYADFRTNGMLEVWDLSSGLLLYDFEKDGHKIEKARFTEDGIFTWAASGENYSRRLSMPVPDESLQAFLYGLCSLDLDAKSGFTCKKPIDSEFQMGNWSGLASGWDTGQAIFQKEEQAASERILLEITNELGTAEDFADRAWFAECDDIWQQLLDGAIPFQALDLDRFYNIYRQGAVRADAVKRLAFGLEAYIQLTLEWMEEESNEEGSDVSDFDRQMIQTLAYTKAYDAEIIQAFRNIIAKLSINEADGSSTDTDGLDEEWDAAAGEYTMRYFQMLLQVLEGSGVAAMADFAEYCTAEPMVANFAPGPVIFCSLYVGEARLASDMTNTWFLDLYKDPAYEDMAQLLLKNHLFLGDVLVGRGQIRADVFDEYLRGIRADVGIEVQQISVEAQKAGLRIGDLIIGVDDNRIADEYHYDRLRKKSKEKYTLEVVRDGAVLTLQMDGPAGFWGKFEVTM